MQKEHTIIIGGGPCGLATAIALQEKGIDALVIEKGNIVDTIYQFPTHQTFFSSADKLEIGNIPFTTSAIKPVRNDALAYYREVVKRKQLRVQSYENVFDIVPLEENDGFTIHSRHADGEMHMYDTKHVVIATGYYDQPRLLGVLGENIPNVMHYFKEAHPYFNTDVVIIGGKNSAVDAALELHHAGANVTVLYRGESYSSSIKPWILPNFRSLVEAEKIKMVFEANIEEITAHHVHYIVNGKKYDVYHDFTFAMTGYEPNIRLLEKTGIIVDDQTGRPQVNKETYETNVNNIFVAGVVISGFNGNETFIENGRFHGEAIAKAITNTKIKE